MRRRAPCYCRIEARETQPETTNVLNLHCAAYLTAAFDAIQQIHDSTDQELELTSLYLLSKFSKLVAGRWSLEGSTFKRSMDLLQMDSNLRKHAAMTLQRYVRSAVFDLEHSILKKRVHV